MADYWMGRDKEYAADFTFEIAQNAEATVNKANLLLSIYMARTGDTERRKVTSGWRPPSLNAATPGAALRSKHMTGQAIDISDPEGDLDHWLIDHTVVLQEVGLWLEHPASTKGWTHWQCVAPKSGNRVFYP